MSLHEWVWQLWPADSNPYEILRRRLRELVRPGMVVLDGGCGYRAPTLQELRGRGARLLGVDLVDLEWQPDLGLVKSDLARIPVPDASVDLVYSRSVMEHVTEPRAVYAEAARVLKPNGRWIFLTANRWDYVSLVARMTPNRLHGRVVKAFEGREIVDVFPTAYKTNDRRQIAHHAREAGLTIDRFSYLSQYPSMFHKWAIPFLIASMYEKLLMRFETLAPLRGWLLVELLNRSEGGSRPASRNGS